MPERYWFQVATGGDAKALAADLKRLRAKHKVLGKLGGVTSPFGKTRRLVVGPFESMKDAKAFEGKAKGDGLDGYVWVSPRRLRRGAAARPMTLHALAARPERSARSPRTPPPPDGRGGNA